MLDILMDPILQQINSLVGTDISNYKAFLTIPVAASFLAFYFIYKGIKFVLRIIFYIFIIVVVFLAAANYFGLI